MNVYYVFSVNKPQFCCPFHGDAAAYTSGHTNFFQRLRVTLSLSSSIIYISSDIQHVVVDGHMVFVLPFDFDMFFFVSPIYVFSFTGGNRCQFPSDGREFVPRLYSRYTNSGCMLDSAKRKTESNFLSADDSSSKNAYTRYIRW